MRKIYLFFLVAMLMPLLAVAQDYNRSLSFAERTSFYTTTDDIVGVDLSVMGEGTTTTTMADQSFSMGTWFRLSKLPDYSVNSYQFANAILMGYRGLNHMNANGCMTIGYQRADSKLILKGFGWGRLGIADQVIDAAVTEGEWHFIAFAVDYTTNTARVFLDDTLAGEYNITGNHGTFDDTPEAFSFGGFGCMGAIDDSFIYNTALTLDDVKKIVAGRPDAVAGLKGWFTFDEVKEGTTNAFANKAEGATTDAMYYSYSGSTDQNGLISGTVSAGTPDLSTITEETARVLPVLECNFTVPSASDYENVESLTFTANGQTLTAGETITFDTDTEITISVTPATGYVVASIMVNGVAVENNGTFVLESDMTKENIVITLGQGTYALTVENAANLSYTLTTSAGTEIDASAITEGSQLRLTIDVPFTHTLNAVLLGENALTGANGVYDFEMPGENTTLTIDATEKTTYTVTIEQSEGATIAVTAEGNTVNSGDRLIPGQVLNITATPDADHFIRAIKANGTAVTGGTLTMPESDVTITVETGDNSTWNKSITYINTTSISSSPEDRVDVEHGILGVSSQAEFVNKSMSVGAWVRMTKRLSSGNQFIRIGGLNHNNDNPLIAICTDSNGELMLDGFGAKDSDRLALTAAQRKLGKVLPLNEWHYVAVTFDFENGEIRSYYDGEKFNTIAITATSFGGKFDDNPYGFGFGALAWNGSMDDIHIVDGAITDADAFNLYSDNAAKVANLVGWYTFDEIKPGTTNHYANQVAAKSDYDAIYYRMTGSDWGGGLVNITRTNGTPDMEYITTQLQRPYISTELENERTVTVVSENEALGTVAITSPATEGNTVITKEKNVTVKATPAENTAFLNWTDAAGNVVSRDATFNYNGENDIELTAHFGYSINYTVGTDGTAEFIANGNAISSGTVVAPGTEVTVTVSPATGKECIFVVNGNQIDLENNVYTFTAESNTDVDITFVDQIYRLSFVVSGDGTMEVWTSFNEDTLDPEGTQIPDHGAIPQDSSIENLVVYFIPGNNQTIESVSYTIGDNKTTLDVAEDLYDCTYKSDNAKVFTIGAADITDDLTITVAFSGETQGIEEIGIDPANGPVEYFNLQGVRVAAENLVPGFYIVRQGEKTVKVLIRK